MVIPQRLRGELSGKLFSRFMQPSWSGSLPRLGWSFPPMGSHGDPQSRGSSCGVPVAARFADRTTWELPHH